MKKVTLSIVLMIKDSEENLAAIQEMQDAVESGELAAGITDDLDDVTATASLLVEEVE
jgi:hypothetical protein